MTIPSPANLPPPAPEVLETKHDETAKRQDNSWLAWLIRDPILIIFLTLTLAINFTLFAYLALRFESLPDPLPLHFDAAGLPDRIEAKTSIFGLPMIGLVVFALNFFFGILFHRRERGATLLIATGALLVQILIWFAAVNIAGGIY